MKGSTNMCRPREVTINYNDTQDNTLPLQITTNTIPLSQTLTDNTPTNNITNNSLISPSMTTRMYTISTQLNPTSTQTQEPVPHKNNFERLFCETDIYYIKEQYCQPISESFKGTPDQCKFNRECLVSKQKVLSKGNLLQSTSQTVFTSVPATSKINKYTLHDVRLLTCFNPTCKQKKNQLPKCFILHVSCICWRLVTWQIRWNWLH